MELIALEIVAAEQDMDVVQKAMTRRVVTRHPEYAQLRRDDGSPADPITLVLEVERPKEKGAPGNSMAAAQMAAELLAPVDAPLPPLNFHMWGNTSSYRSDHCWSSRTRRFRTLTLNMSHTLAEVGSLADVSALAEAAQAGAAFGVAGYFVDGFDYLGLSVAKAEDGRILPYVPVFLEPGSGMTERLDPETVFYQTRCVSRYDACDVPALACIDLAERLLGIGDLQDCYSDSVDWGKASLHAERALHVQATATQDAATAELEVACREALESLPCVVPLRLEDALDSKRLVPGQRVRLSAHPSHHVALGRGGDVGRDIPDAIEVTLPGQDGPHAVVDLQRARAVVEKESLLGALPWAGCYLLYALLPHLRAWICRVKPVYSADSGDDGYAVDVALALAEADCDVVVADAVRCYEDRAEDERVSTDITEPLVLDAPSETGRKPLAKIPKTRKKQVDALAEGSARSLALTALVKMWKARGLPQMVWTDGLALGIGEGTVVHALPAGVVYVDTKAKQMIAFDLELPDGWEDYEKDEVAKRLGLIPQDAKPPVAKVLDGLLGDDVVPEPAGRGGSLVLHTVKLSKEAMLYLLCSAGAVTPEQLAGYDKPPVGK